MKRIINGKMYNTETAKLIKKYQTTTNHSDFNFRCEELYKKKTGEYFLYKYGFGVGAGYEWGEKIIIYSSQKAIKRWMEAYSTTDEYILEFGKVEE